MEKKKRRVEKIVLEINELKSNSFHLPDESIFNRTMIFTQKYGQLKIIIINENHEIIDGNMLYLAMKKIGCKRVNCYKFHNLTKVEEAEIKITLSHLRYEMDTLKFADEIGKVVEVKIDAQHLFNKVDIQPVDIMRYSKLKEVDWKKELKQAEFELEQQGKFF